MSSTISFEFTYNIQTLLSFFTKATPDWEIGDISSVGIIFEGALNFIFAGNLHRHIEIENYALLPTFFPWKGGLIFEPFQRTRMGSL